ATLWAPSWAKTLRPITLRPKALIILGGLLMAGCSLDGSDDRKQIDGLDAPGSELQTHDQRARYGSYKIGTPYIIKGQRYIPAIDYSYAEEGIASWYGPAFHGKLTANGAIFDMNAISAAHRTLPLPSWVMVTNLENGRALKVLVNDRGPYIDGRILDLSRKAARILGFEQQGVVWVRVEILAGESRKLARQLSALK
ncbi:MAG: septal ring lytic transglycosylase RlpA family protein, partial [Pseudomonadota bacterium]